MLWSNRIKDILLKVLPSEEKNLTLLLEKWFIDPQKEKITFRKVFGKVNMSPLKFGGVDGRLVPCS